MAKPKQYVVRKSVYVSKQLEESLEKEAAEKGTNFSNLVRMILTEREKDKKIRMTVSSLRNLKPPFTHHTQCHRHYMRLILLYSILKN